MKNKEVNNKIYGFWSMLASIVGVVVGIGIFFKNDSISNLSGNNPTIAILSWVVGSILILAMTYSFIEIASVRLSKGKEGSLSQWSKKFLGKKGAIIISSYWHYIYIPLTYLVLATFSTDMIVSAIRTSNPDWLTNSPLELFAFYFFVILGLLILIPLANTFFNRPGQVAQVTGTIIKFIPLLFVVIGSIVVMFIPGSAAGNDLDFSQKDTATNGFFLLLATMPAILFSFDGFIAVSSLQNQATSKKTYIKALFSGLLLISILYILISLLSFLIGDSNTGYSISAILAIITNNQTWIQILLLVIIFISGITSLNGFTLAGRWDNYNNSSEKLFYDKNNSNQELDKKTNLPKKSSLNIWMIATSWFLLIFGISFIVLLFNNSFNVILLIDQLSNSYIVLAFLMYTAIILGAVYNRKSKKNEVKKLKYFVPISLLTSLFLIGINIYSFIITIRLSVVDPSDLTGFFLIGIILIWFLITYLNYESVKSSVPPLSVAYKKFVYVPYYYLAKYLPIIKVKESKYLGNVPLKHSDSGSKAVIKEETKWSKRK